MDVTIFKLMDFVSAAGLNLSWKAICDKFDADSWACAAKLGADKLGRFSDVTGVPTGGFKLEHAMRPYVDRNVVTVSDRPRYHNGRALVRTPPLLIVDDVWTTGHSMRLHVPSGCTNWIGYVVFARGKLPPNVKAFWQFGLAD